MNRCVWAVRDLIGATPTLCSSPEARVQPGIHGILTDVSRPSARLIRTVRRDYPPGQVDEAIALLSEIPETFPLAERQDPERLQAAALLRAAGDTERLRDAIDLGRQDWRDLLMYTGLEHPDWLSRLRTALRR